MPAMGDLFAPAYRANDPASVQAVNDWQNRVFNVNSQNIEQTRKPVSFNTGKPGGMLDPEALRVMAQGGPYDFDARRDAIAAAAIQAPATAAANNPNLAALRAQMSPQDIQTFQQQVSPQEFQAFMSATPAAAPADAGNTNWYNAINSGVGVGG